MALMQEYNFHGLVIQNAYIRIDRIYGGKQEGWNGVVGIYPSADKAAELDIPIMKLNISACYSESETNPYKLLYDELKATEFPGALDC